MKKEIKEFFEQHPGVDEVHEALGVLFTEKADAEAFLGGVHGHEVASYTREAASETEADIKAKKVTALQKKIDGQKAVVGKKTEAVAKATAGKKATAELALNTENEKLASLEKELADLITPTPQ